MLQVIRSIVNTVAIKLCNMKKQIFGLALLIFTACNTSKPTINAKQGDTVKITGTADVKLYSDTTRRDSLAYVKSILSNKGKYINKEFGVLIKALDMQVKSYSSVHVNRVLSSGIIISFDDWITTRNKTEGVKGLKDPVRMLVEWQKPVSRADVEAHLKNAAGDWHKAEQDYYSKLIVKDIR